MPLSFSRGVNRLDCPTFEERQTQKNYLETPDSLLETPGQQIFDGSPGFVRP